MPDLGFSQFQKISQEQILSPQVLHALKILQVPSMELAREIADEMAKNPLLEEIAGTEKNGEVLPTAESGSRDEEHPDGDVGSDALEITPENEPDEFEEGEKWLEPENVPAGGTAWTREDEERRTRLFDSLVERESLPQLLARPPVIPAF